MSRVDGDVRELAPRVLAALMRRFGDLPAGEDAVQEALVAAAVQWPRQGRPASPVGWLATVASRRRIDEVRSEAARRDREAAHVPTPGRASLDGTEIGALPVNEDDSLDMLLLCCHPALAADSQIALTLRAVGGLSTARIARAFLVPEPTMAQRISRAKRTIQNGGGRFPAPHDVDRAARTAAVLRVLYLIFTEGHTASTGQELTEPPLVAEAVRLTRMLHRALPDDDEVCGLLALMLLSTARDTARSIGGPLGPYQLQAAIVAVHATAADMSSTDWPQVLALYDLLQHLDPSPVVALNRAVAVAEVHGAAEALNLVEHLAHGSRLARQHRLPAVRAHLRERTGDLEGARRDYAEAAARTANAIERTYLGAQGARLAETGLISNTAQRSTS